MHRFTALFPFGGSGGGALGFAAAEARLLGSSARFEVVGSLDFDEVACDDFTAFTGAPAWHVDVEDVTPEQLRERFGAVAPDVVFMSPPCKGSSRLLSQAKARTAKYQRMNRLSVVWTRVMLQAWSTPPALVLLENVPGLPSRAAGMLEELRELLEGAGYVLHHEDHDCGELGGLAQHRRRFLLVARHPGLCPSLLYQPQKRRVRGVGEVLSALPMPATLAAEDWGPLHTMPRISWRNWLRLALIPAGGDWRDLEGVLKGRARREVFRRHAVQDWDQPHPAVTGPGGHSVDKVADPRAAGATWHGGAYGVRSWKEPSGAVTGGADNPSRGSFSVADPRLTLGCSPRSGAYGVSDWKEPSKTVTASGRIDNRPVSVADIRVTRAYDAGYGVLKWDHPARTIAGNISPGCGAYAVSDARARTFGDDVRVLTLDEAMALELEPKKAPPFVPVIIADDGAWHRPLTPRELSALQGYPLRVDGAPIPWAGTRTQVAEHIGNSVPPPSAKAVAERMLIALLEAELGGFSLAGPDTPVWVDRGVA
jgi:site-specific DNA-cytosine methylase